MTLSERDYLYIIIGLCAGPLLLTPLCITIHFFLTRRLILSTTKPRHDGVYSSPYVQPPSDFELRRWRNGDMYMTPAFRDFPELRRLYSSPRPTPTQRSFHDPERSTSTIENAPYEDPPSQLQSYPALPPFRLTGPVFFPDFPWVDPLTPDDGDTLAEHLKNFDITTSAFRELLVKDVEAEKARGEEKEVDDAGGGVGSVVGEGSEEVAGPGISRSLRLGHLKQ